MTMAARFLTLLFVSTSLGCSTSSAPQRPTEQKASTAKQAGGRSLPPPGQPVVGKIPPMPEPVDVPDPPQVRVETVASGLVVPWDIVFPSANRAYVTERPGRVRLIENGKLRPEPYARITRVVHTGEGGLTGMALHPDYPRVRRVYLMYTYQSGGGTYNRVSVFDDTGTTLNNEKTMIEGIRGASYHDGGALRFGPDGMLYVGTGDGGNPESAQDRNSLNGKILRLPPEGKPPADNPFANSPVYAYGFRNVEGLAWNANGDLWATNHGPSGEFNLEAMDSVFIVKKGGNHGWPRSLGVTDIASVVPPVLWFPDSSVPPALAMFYRDEKISGLKGNFLFASLRDEALYRIVLSGPRTIRRIERWFGTGTHSGRLGRLRAVVEGPDGAIYISTSNRDRRGTLQPNDDHIYRIVGK